jgi:predicted amidohydrolase YtcJ
MRRDADLLLVNARPWSDGAPIQGCDAIAIAAGRILALGRARELDAAAGPGTRRIDVRGATVTPGCTDAHIHLASWACARAELTVPAAPRDAVLRAVARWIAEHPGDDVVVGRGWLDAAWNEPPERAALDAVTGERPVLLDAHDDHTLWVNSAALARAGVGRDTPDPPGGGLERDAAGEPNGIVREHATRLFRALRPRRGPEHQLEALRRAVVALHAEGVTAIHDFEGPDEQRLLHALTDTTPRVRVLMHLAHAGLEGALALGLESGLGDDCFRVGAVKLFADGTLGSRTAALLHPYDGTSETGWDLIDPAELRSLVARALNGRLAVAIHAIGDRAVRSALDAFEAAGPARGAPRLPSRIEHVQLLDDGDRPRFAALGIVASMQPIHCTSDLELAARHWNSRLARAYPWRALLQSGARLAFGSDAPIERPSVAAGLHAAVTRQRGDGTPRGGFVPEQRITLDDALTAYTEAPARMAGTWPRLGRLAPGALADLVVWDQDLHRLPVAELAGAKPAFTILDGEIVFAAERRPAASLEVPAT